jgi:hypothetical protein
LRTADRAALRLQHGHHALHIAQPLRAAAHLRRLAHAETPDRLAQIAGQHLDDVVIAGRRGDDGVAVDGAGHGEALVVVGVLADQVDAGGRPGQPLRRGAEGAQESLRHAFTRRCLKWSCHAALVRR